MFDRNIAVLDLSNIQDVTTHVDGLFASTLGYGSVVVQTSAAGKEFVIDQIAGPEELRSVIMQTARR
jgi:predicted transglutaminase-like protease